MADADSSAERGKQTVALGSLAAAFALTTFKIVVGVLTGSLGILAEAAHSGLDLIAAGVTVVAVRLSGKPPDEGHTYGHGKIDNLSALFESLLLLGTSVWIIFEAVKRLSAGNPVVEVNAWSFLVMITSIVIDLSRSHVLFRAAKQHHSQALEADAIHFETDVWSSAVVIVGLISVKIAGLMPQLGWLRHADAIAALGVAALVSVVSVRLGVRTIEALVDAAPAGCARRIVAAAEAVPGVIDCHDVRVRHSGPVLFADVHVTVDGTLPLREAHALTEEIEAAVRKVLPAVDLVVHPEPAEVEAPGAGGDLRQ